MSNPLPSPDCDAHAGCQEAWEYQRLRADFIQARLDHMLAEFRLLAQAMDSISGHATHDRLGGRTLGGAVRFIVKGEPAPRPTAPGRSLRDVAREHGVNPVGTGKSVTPPGVGDDA